MALLDTMIAGQESLRRIRENDSMARAAFGATWRRENTDWKQVEAILGWVERQNEAGLGSSFRSMFADIADLSHVAGLVEELKVRFAAAREHTLHLSHELALDCRAAFEETDFERADDIDQQRASGRGVAAFKTFLSFAKTGRLSIAQLSGRDEDSPFEEAVRRSIESLGHQVHPQVGIAGFYIDLAVVDPRREGSYLLGIECDGAAYHSCRSARDRDRLRQAVLEDHGWRIHRVWSSDWFQRPAEQLERIAGAIAEETTAAIDSDSAAPDHKDIIDAENGNEIEREAVAEAASKVAGSTGIPYIEADFKITAGVEPHQMQTKELAAVVLRIVELEGPVHEDEAINRVRDLWGLGRAGARIQDAVARAVRSLLVTRRCSREEGFLSIPGAEVRIRNRETVRSASLRKPEMLPPAEIRRAILDIIDLSHGATRNEIPTAVARMLGYKSTGAQLRYAIEVQRDKLIRAGVLEVANGLVKRSRCDSD
jgi:very-short-patch-repair endonuclease